MLELCVRLMLVDSLIPFASAITVVNHRLYVSAIVSLYFGFGRLEATPITGSDELKRPGLKYQVQSRQTLFIFQRYIV
jgi:hypothetical protein